MKAHLNKFRHLHIVLFVLGLLIGLLFMHKEWLELAAFLVLVIYCCWNVFAFLHDRSMLGAPKMTANVTKNGDKGARQFLFAVSVFLYIFLSVLWIWRYLKGT